MNKSDKKVDNHRQKDQLNEKKSEQKPKPQSKLQTNKVSKIKNKQDKSESKDITNRKKESKGLLKNSNTSNEISNKAKQEFRNPKKKTNETKGVKENLKESNKSNLKKQPKDESKKIDKDNKEPELEISKEETVIAKNWGRAANDPRNK